MTSDKPSAEESALNTRTDAQFWDELRSHLGVRLSHSGPSDAPYRRRWTQIRDEAAVERPHLSGPTLHALADKRFWEEIASLIGRPLSPTATEQEHYRRRWGQIRRAIGGTGNNFAVAANRSADLAEAIARKHGASPKDSLLPGQTAQRMAQNIAAAHGADEGFVRKWPVNLSDKKQLREIMFPNLAGQGTLALARVMRSLYRLDDPGQAEPLLQELAPLRGATVEKMRSDYARFLVLRSEARTNAAAKKIGPPDELASGGQKKRMGDAYWGQPDQMRFGKIVGDALGVDAVFGAMLSPTGGLIGPGDSALHHYLQWSDVIKTHGVVHDAAGYLSNYHNVGPGYEYVDALGKWAPHIDKDKHMYLGQGTGVAFWAKEYTKQRIGAIGEGIADFGSKVGQGILNFGRKIGKKASDIGNTVVQRVENSFDYGKYAHDGALTGPFYPKDDPRRVPVGPQPGDPEAMIAGREASIFINGVATTYEKHCRAAQELADANGKPVVGIYNATAGWRDGFQYVADKFGIGDREKRNPAMGTLMRLIRSYGDPKDKQGAGLEIFAHSHGTVIVTEALRRLKAEGANISDVDFTAFGNASYSQVEGIKASHYYAFDDDAVATLFGSSGFGGSKARQWAPWFGSRSTAQHTTLLHHGGKGDRPHGVVQDAIKGKAEFDGKYDGQQSYIGALKQFREVEKAQKAAHPLVKGMRQEIMPYRSLMATSFAFTRHIGQEAADAVGAGYEYLDKGMSFATQPDFQLAPGPMRYLPGLAWRGADLMLRGAGRGVRAIGDGIGSGMDYLMGGRAPDSEKTGVQRFGGSGSADMLLTSGLDPALIRQTLLAQGGTGSPAPSALRQRVEPLVGANLAHARLHQNPAAAAAAATLNADAFTIGHDIFFGANRLDTAAPQGQGLVAHELTHVAQQTGGRAGDRAQFFSRSGGDAMEQEAQRIGGLVSGGGLTLPHPPVVRNYSVVLDSQGDDLEGAEQDRLTRLGEAALEEARYRLSLANLPSGELDTVSVTIELDLDAMTDGDALEAWAGAIVTAVLAETQRAATETSRAVGGVQRQIQRSEADENEETAPSLGKALLKGALGGLLIAGGGAPLLVGAGIGLAALAAYDLYQYKIGKQNVVMDQMTRAFRLQRSPNAAEPPSDIRIKAIQQILKQSWVGPLSEWEIEALWEQYGPAVDKAAEANWRTWLDSVERGAELADLKAVKARQEQFKADVKTQAKTYLQRNRVYVTEELKKFASSASPTDPKQDGLQQSSLNDVRRLARWIAEAQQAQRSLQKIPVGYAVRPGIAPFDPGGIMTAYFDPDAPPQMPPDAAEGAKFGDWRQIKSSWDRLQTLVLSLADQSPAFYAASIEGHVADLTGNDDTVLSRNIRVQLSGLLTNIQQAELLLDDGSINPLSLVPIHHQFFSGQARAATDWGGRFNRWSAEQAVRNNDNSRFWTQLGVGTLAGAAFLLAEFATAGSATFFLAAGAGVGMSAGMAAESWDRYFDLQTAAKATAKSDTKLVEKGQVDEAKTEAILTTAFALADAYGTAARGVVRITRASKINSVVQSVGKSVKSHPLRMEYEQAVNALSGEVQTLRAQKLSSEEIARQMWWRRRFVSTQYKEATPEALRDYIYSINRGRYQDELGPSFEYLVKKYNGDFEKIIEASTRPNPDIDDLLGGFEQWMQKNGDKYISPTGEK